MCRSLAVQPFCAPTAVHVSSQTRTSVYLPRSDRFSLWARAVQELLRGEELRGVQEKALLHRSDAAVLLEDSPVEGTDETGMTEVETSRAACRDLAS